MEVPYHVKSYPRPSPPTDKKEDIFDPRDFAAIDDWAKQTPEDKTSDFGTLVKHLTGHLRSDVEKVRALFIWLGSQDVVKTTYPAKTEPDSPTAMLKEIKENNDVYSKMFTVLCREAGIPCVILEGQGRVAIEPDSIGHATWNAVYLEGAWRFIHCYWAFIAAIGRVTGGYLKIEQDGQKMREEVQEVKGTVEHTKTKREGYFLVDPQAFIFHCHPSIEKWQLVKAPLSLKRFGAQPYIWPLFYESGFFFRPGQAGKIKSVNGECDVVIKGGRNKAQLAYTLYYKQTPDSVFPTSEGADRYVIMLNKNSKGEHKFRVRFPIEGEYKLSLKKKKGMDRLCDFRLICKERKARCNPLPETPAIGWGPGPTAKAEGVYDTSHDDGIIESKDDKNLEISFKTRGKRVIKPRLKSVVHSDNMCKQFLTTSIKNNNVSIKVDALDGEYALIIDAVSSKGDTEYKNILNYIVQCGRENTRPEGMRENPTEKQVRQHLKDATKGRKKDDLVTYIEKFRKLRMDDKGHLTRARQTLEQLEVKETLRYALMRERTDEIEKAIRRAETSEVEARVRPDIQRAQLALDRLNTQLYTPRALSAVNRRNMAELRGMRTLSGAQQDTIAALYILLGENRKDVKDPVYLKGLVVRSGSDGLLQRLDQLSTAEVRPKAVVQAKRLLDSHQEDITRQSELLRKLHQAGVDFVERYNRAKSPSIRNEEPEDTSTGNAFITQDNQEE